MGKIKKERFKRLDKLGFDGVVEVYLRTGSVQGLCNEVFAGTVHKDWPDSNPTKALFYSWLRKRELFDRWQTEAKAMRAEGLLEESLAETEGVDEHNVRARSFVARQKLDVAKALDRSLSGKSVDITSNGKEIGGAREVELLMELTALARELQPMMAPVDRQIEVVEAEVIDSPAAEEDS